MHARFLLPFALASGVLAVDAAAQCDVEKLLASDAPGWGKFGSSVSLSGGRALVGAPEVGGAGGAYVFENGVGGWLETQKLVPAVPKPYADFGAAVSLDGDRAAVGANKYPGAPVQWGAVYVFDRVGSTWIQQQLLLSDQLIDEQGFGTAVSLEGDRLVVGEPGPFPHPGWIHVFERIGGTWKRVAKLTIPGAHTYFGYSVSLDGDRIAAGAFGLDVGSTYEGAVQLVERDAQGVWSLTQTLLSTTPTAQGRFGYSVDLQGDRLAIGATYEHGRVANAGAIHVLGRSGSTWLETARIAAPDGENGDSFGAALALDGDRIAVGAEFDSVGALYSGSTYVIERGASGWSTVLKKAAPAPDTYQHFGSTVALDGSSLLVGAFADDQFGTTSGAAHRYGLDAAVSAYCQTTPNSVGDGARLSSAGSTSLAQNDFHLACDGAPAGKFGKFFYGPQPTNLAFGNGRLCIGGQFFRLDATTSSSTGNGFDWLDFAAPPASSGPGQILAGSAWYFQYWYRDPAAGGAMFNLSNGLQVTFCP